MLTHCCATGCEGRGHVYCSPNSCSCNLACVFSEVWCITHNAPRFGDAAACDVFSAHAERRPRFNGVFAATAALALLVTLPLHAGARPAPPDPTVRESRSWICIVGARENPAYVGTFRSRKSAEGFCSALAHVAPQKPCTPQRLWLPAKEVTK